MPRAKDWRCSSCAPPCSFWSDRGRQASIAVGQPRAASATATPSSIDRARAQGPPVAQHRARPRRTIDRGRAASRAGRRKRTSARSAAACGRRPTAARTGRRSPTARSRARRSARSPSRSRTPTSSSSAWASRAFAATSCRATASTSRPTPARRGRTSASRTRRRSRKIRIHPTNPDIVFVAAFGKYGAPSDERGVFKSTDGGKTWTQGALPRRQDRRGRHLDRPHEPERACTPRCGRRTASSIRCRAAARAAASSSRPTAARRGPRSRATPGCRRASIGTHRRRRLRRRLRTASTRSSRTRTAACSVGRRRRDVDARQRATATSGSARSTTRTSPPTRRTRDVVYVLNIERCTARPTAARR